MPLRRLSQGDQLLPLRMGRQLYAHIRSVIETARRSAVGAFQAIRLTLLPQPLPDTG